MKKCPNCNQYNEDYAQYCSNCGYTFNGSQTNAGGTTPPPVYNQGNNLFDSTGPQGKSRGVAALLAIFLGGLGIQYFYLGKTGAGLITIGLTLISCGLFELLMFIQGIYMLCITNEQFQQKYVDTTSSFPMF